MHAFPRSDPRARRRGSRYDGGAVGADSPVKSEIDPDLMAAAKVAADSLEQCAAIGDLHHAIEAGRMVGEDVHAELGDLIAGSRPGRESDEETIVFDSTGTALQDVASASLVYQRALALERRGSGTARRLRGVAFHPAQTRRNRLSCLLSRDFQDLIEEEKIGEQRPEVNRRVQVVDEPRTHCRLSHYETDGRACARSIPLDHTARVPVGVRRIEPVCDAVHLVNKRGQRFIGPVQVFTQLSTGSAGAITGQTLSSVCEEVFVALLNGVDVLSEIVDNHVRTAFPSLT